MKNVLIVILILLSIGLIGFLIFSSQKAVSQTTAITLDFTAPGDDGVVGTASSYQLRYSPNRPDTTSTAAMDTWWASATNITALPVPLVAGTSQSVVVTAAFQGGATYYFLLKACDEVPNCSGYSNVAFKFIPDNIPPARVTDLRTR